MATDSFGARSICPRRRRRGRLAVSTAVLGLLLLRRPRGIGRLLLVGIAVFLTSTVALGVAGEVTAPEPQIKAAYLHRLTKFANWPDGTFPESAAPFVIGFVGSSPSGIVDFLDKAARQGLLVKDRPVRIERLLYAPKAHHPKEGTRRDRFEAALRQCHLLFVPKDRRSDWDDIRDLIRALPLLTVSDQPGFADSGGHVEFVLTASGTIDIRVNLDASQRNGLTFSSRFLSLKSVFIIGDTPSSSPGAPDDGEP